MNILNWILFILLNVCLTSGVSGFRLVENIAFWMFFIEGYNDYGLAFLWFFLVFPLQILILPVFYEFLNKKSQIFLFLNKLKNLIFAFKIIFFAMIIDVFSFLIISKLSGLPFEKPLIPLYCACTLLAGYFCLAIWLRLRKCILFRLRKIMKFLGKWFGKRKFATLKNIIITMHLIFAGEIVAICCSSNRSFYLFFLSCVIISLLFIELISILSFVKKQKVKPFQKGVIFIIALLIFIHTQLAMILQFLTILSDRLMAEFVFPLPVGASR